MRLAPVPLLLIALAGCEAPRPPAASSESAEAAVTAPGGTAEIPPGPESSTVPAAYRGVWDRDAAACAGAPGELRLTVGPRALLFYESTAEVNAVRTVGDGLEVETTASGEGAVEARTYRLALEAGRLAVGIGGTTVERVRCGQTEAGAQG